MRRSLTKTAALGAAAALGVGALLAAPVAQAADGNTSLAELLEVGSGMFDSNKGDFDILTKAAEAVLAAKPDSAVAVLADGDTALTVFAPTDKAFMDLASALSGSTVSSESDAFDAVAGLGIDTVENVLLYHVIPGKTITSKDALNANGAVLPTAYKGKNTKVIVLDGPIIRLRDYAPAFKNAQVILDLVNVNDGNKQIAHGVDAVMLPFKP